MPTSTRCDLGASLDEICGELDRDPATLERSVGVIVRPLDAAASRADTIAGSVEEIADAFRSFRDGGFTRLEIMLHPGTMEALDALAPVLEHIRAD